ncbi:hypothetical protein AOY38_01960 [Synechocystis sp. PCC 6803]|jgi:hypothetical protein|uniref:hypothetical protein n=1 Tax=unclassified Synechocystis TaxID=2640012 RepID=UPI0002D2BD00|nr:MULTISPECIES: hypothetical protein [unclassified Synechocystis]ALJ66717.1 hypothetical protein AOY38_01960 [Synechocystis sp. PCC 6803]AVP88564.1 hypothetical protein C7I86_01985 [Synechocystis sp. IPPAS B-1465]QHU99024.1 hypothetical protein BWK47_02000 [Synechocystis sp. CACIAM 05]
MVIIALEISQSGKSGAKPSIGAGDRQRTAKFPIGEGRSLGPAPVFHREIKKNLWLDYEKVKQIC